LTFVTANPIEATLAGLASSYACDFTTDVVRVHRLDAPAEIEAALAAGTIPHWNALIVPYEHAVVQAAAFAEYTSPTEVIYHGLGAARLSRDKRQFREFVAKEFADHPVISPTRAVAIPLAAGADTEANDPGETLLRRISTALDSGIRRVVIKPLNASGSMGVRPLNLDDPAESLATAREFLRVFERLPAEQDIGDLVTDQILVEERIPGEEFSIESRKVGDSVETLAIHWKVDVERDRRRFFERLFVTIQADLWPYGLLDACNAEVIRRMGARDGVFHGEYRVWNNHVYPLEIGFRPGGGMLSESVMKAVGVDLFDELLARAMRRAPLPRNSRPHAVAMGLFFADGRGVLPFLEVESPQDLSRHIVVPGDEQRLRRWLQDLCSSMDRRVALRELAHDLLARGGPLCSPALEALSSSVGSELGFAVEMANVELFMAPGEEVTEEEAFYITGFLAIAGPRLSGWRAVVEALAACDYALNTCRCVPRPRLPALTAES
jgi:hypothetical protein